MSKTIYHVYIISENGNGMTQEINTWAGEDELRIHLGAFSKDAVLIIEPEVAT